MFHRIAITFCLLLVLTLALSLPPLHAQPSGYEYFDPAPVESTFIAAFTPEDLAFFDYAGLRLIEFDVIDADEQLFVGSFIANEGKYARSWDFEADKSRSNLLFESADPLYMGLDIERTYFANGSKEWHYAVLWVDNVNNTPWAVIADEDYETLSSLSRNRRPIDLDENAVGETTEGPGPTPGFRYDAILVDNTVDNYMVYSVSWLSGEQLNAIGQSKWGWVPIDIQPSSPKLGEFVCVLVLVPNVKTPWFYHVGSTEAVVEAHAAINGRLTNIEPNLSAPGTFNATILFDK
jgi:hypothetical protein